MDLFQGTVTQAGHGLAVFQHLLQCSERNKPQQYQVGEMQSNVLMPTPLFIPSIFTQRTVLVLPLSGKVDLGIYHHSGENSSWPGLYFSHVHSKRYIIKKIIIKQGIVFYGNNIVTVHVIPSSFFQENINSCNFNFCWHRAVVPKLQHTWESPAGLLSCRFLGSTYRVLSSIGPGCGLRICILEVHTWWWCCWSRDHIFRTCGSHSYASSSHWFQMFPTVMSSYLLSTASQALIFTSSPADLAKVQDLDQQVHGEAQESVVLTGWCCCTLGSENLGVTSWYLQKHKIPR